MKKRTTAILAFITVTAMSMAGTVRENCGCGVGSMAFGDQEGIVSHLAATFLNGISGNQTFGVSSGTLDCNQSTSIVGNQKVKQFVSDNMDSLVGDIAAGNGESLDSLADIMQVKPEQRLAMYDTLQANFDSIFTSDAVTADQVVANLAAVL